MSTMTNRTEHTMSRRPLSDMAKVNATGLVVAAVGFVIQIVGGIDLPAVPPGLVMVVVAAGLVAAFAARWRWVPFVGVIVPLFLLVSGTLAITNEDEPNRTDVVGLFGTVVQAIGLVVALIAGLQVVRQTWCGRPPPWGARIWWPRRRRPSAPGSGSNPNRSLVSFGHNGAAMTHLLEHAVLDEHAMCLHRVPAAARWSAPAGRGAPVVLGDVARRMPRLARNIAVAHAALFRLTRGRALSRWFGNPILVLETIGRHTGMRRATPLVYVPLRNGFAVVPANAGADRPPAWWLNLQAAGQGFAVLNGQRQRITPRVATGPERDRLWQEFRTIAPIEHYRCRSRRALPIVVLARAGASTSVRRRRSAAYT